MDLLTNILQDRVRDLVLRPPVPTSVDQTIGTVVEQMRRGRSGCALITDSGRLLGIFTERDVLSRVLLKGAPLSDPIRSVMTPRPATVRPTDTVAQVIRVMHSGGYRHLPVVDENEEVVGVVSVRAVVGYLAEHFPNAVFNLPPSPGQVQTQREGA